MNREANGRSEFTERFRDRAMDYSLHRPRYPQEVMERLRKDTELSSKTVVADVGSGTGILAELFLKNGNLVYGIEPNDSMRMEAVAYLKRFGNKFVSVDGRAEATGLDGQSVGLVSVGQALHWFDIGGAREEFARILRSPGYVAIVYNHRRTEGGAEKAYSGIVDKYGIDRASIPDVDDSYVSRFLRGAEFRKSVIPNFQVLDLDGLIGRLASASYMPARTDAGWQDVERDARRAIQEFGSDGKVKIGYDTVLYMSKLH